MDEETINPAIDTSTPMHPNTTPSTNGTAPVYRVATRDDLDRVELRTEYVDVPEWELRVRIKELMGSDRDAYEASIVGTRVSGKKNAPRELNLQNARARLVCRAMIDDTGKRLYADNEAHLLGRKPAKGLERIYDAVRALSGISDEDEKELEETTENFT